MSKYQVLCYCLAKPDPHTKSKTLVSQAIDVGLFSCMDKMGWQILMLDLYLSLRKVATLDLLIRPSAMHEVRALDT